MGEETHSTAGNTAMSYPERSGGSPYHDSREESDVTTTA